MNPFEAHGIKHLSPSAIQAYARSPAAFVVERLFKLYTPSSPAMERGKAAETGIVSGLLDPGKDVEECVEEAMQLYRIATALMTSAARDKQAAIIPGTVRQAIAKLRPFGIPSHVQEKVVKEVDGLAVPIIGYYDVYWEQHGLLTDIKTSDKLASAIKPSHAQQVGFYNWAISDNIKSSIVYCTDKKCEIYGLENARKHAESLVKQAFSIQKFLSLSDDPRELAQYVTPDYEHYFWNTPQARQNGYEVFGF